MLRTTVPVAAIDEEGDSLPWKDNIGHAPEDGQRSKLLAEAQAEAMDR
jgi:hypothetical protein